MMVNESLSEYDILPMGPEDAEGLTRCNMRAFENDFLHQLMFPKDSEHLTAKDDFVKWRIQRAAERLRGENSVAFKAVLKDHPEVLVGYTTWLKPGHYSKGKSAASMEPALGDVAAPKPDTEAQREDHPACKDMELFHGIIAQIDGKRKEIWGDDANFWCNGQPRRVTNLR
ncbi:hypothetical protein LTR85_009371 [Meristemomyces frigidus]|nr:hypothetical protein LTR85_009371 [Meristemomyces frigidus]